MHRTLAPDGASSHTCKAPARVAPAEMPTKIPPLRASSRESSSARAPLTGTTRSISFSVTASAEVLSHGHNERIAFLCAHHSEPDTGIPARRLDYRLSWSKLSRALGIFDDSESQSVLDGPRGVEGFYLDVQAYLRGRELLDPHHRCASNRDRK